MIVHLDTSLLVDALTSSRQSATDLGQALARGHQLHISTVALYEWLRGPRTDDDLLAQESLFPSHVAIVFGPAEATRAASLYRHVRRPRGRIMDLAIAACAIEHRARLWTLNPADFADVPGLLLYRHEDGSP